MKKIITLTLLLIAINFAGKAQAPTIPNPPANPTGDASEKESFWLHRERWLVGTATALLLTIGAGAVAYKVRKNNEEENL